MNLFEKSVSLLLSGLLLLTVSCAERDGGTTTSEQSAASQQTVDATNEVTDAQTETPAPSTDDDAVGLDITDKRDLVSICYSIWFDPVLKAGIYNVQQILDKQASGQSASWGPKNAFHYWSEPALGYYSSTDKAVYRTHMTQLWEAGVDFIIIDNTNGNAKTWGTYYADMVTKPMKALLETILEMRAEGLKTPYVVLWNRVNEDCGWSTCEKVYTDFMKKEMYADCWVYWDGKPLMLLTNKNTTGSMKITDFKYNDELTTRAMTVGIMTGNVHPYEWTFLSDKGVPCKNDAGEYEQGSVYVARQTTYMSTTSTAIGRKGGATFYNQWRRMFQYRPKVVTVTWWNEWVAQRSENDANGGFVDNYNQEYSRDIEPMKGGHGDKYYQWLKQYIAAYRAGETCPKLYDGAGG